MKNVWRVFKRDVLRLFKAPAALVVVIALTVLPSLYTWLNVVGFWDPYNNTGNLRVCVVNEDQGASTDITGSFDLGKQVCESLESNDNLDWVFATREDAMEQVRSGKAYATFIVPRNFSANIASLVTGDFHQPELEYYVNEKAGPVSTKITDTGASTLDQTINTTFVSTVSFVVADAIDGWLADSQGKIDDSNARVSSRFNKAIDAIADAQESIGSLKTASNNALAKTAEAKGSLEHAKGTIALMSSQLEIISSLSVSAQDGLNQFVALVTPALDEGSLLASQAATGANAAIGSAVGALNGSQAEVEAALASARESLDRNMRIIEQLEGIAGLLPPDDPGRELVMQVVSGLKQQNDVLGQTIADTESVHASTVASAQAVASASDKVNTAFQGGLEVASEYRGTLASTTIPAINKGLSQIGSTSGTLAGAIANQTLLVDQAQLVLDQLTSTLNTTSSALDATDDLLGGLHSELLSVRDDISALGAAGMLSELLGEDRLDAGKVADFMLSPTQLKTESLYPINAYGSTMAPLFTNLTLWIGVFMLMVILKQEMDDEGIPHLTLSQRYLGRGLFLAVIASLQAVTCCTGSLIIGVQAASVPVYYLTAIAASLTYLSIQYALSVTLRQIGKGICVILVFVQIPGASGLYPVEMTQPFFQAVYPFFPFTYGINAMREAIAGFYGGQWVHNMAILLVFFAVFLAFGLFVRPYLTNLNRLFAKQIIQSDILNGEDVQVPPRRFRSAQLIRAISDPEAYRVQLHRHARKFFRLYPGLRRGGFIAGIVVPLVLTGVLTLTQSEKVAVLTMWLSWLVCVFVYLMVIECIRDSFERQFALEGMSEEELRDLWAERETAHEAPLAPMLVETQGACARHAKNPCAPEGAAQVKQGAHARSAAQVRKDAQSQRGAHARKGGGSR